MIALYSRVSTQEQAVEGYSIGEQRDRLAAFSTSFGWKDFRQYSDPGFSGASLDRPALQELIRDVEAGKVSRVIVYRLDRLSRSQKDTLFLIEDVFLAHGCEFVSMSESFSTETPVGRATIGLLAVFAQLERETIKERMMTGRVARAKSGLAHYGPDAPAGYAYQDKRLHVIEDEALQIREIFRLYSSGLSLREVTLSLNSAGLFFQGRPWTWGHVKTVLHNPIYAGLVRFQGQTYEGQHEAIVSPELFDRCQELMQARRTSLTSHAGESKGSALLTGLVFCARCGARLTPTAGFRKGHRYAYYQCSHRGSKFSGARCDARPVRQEKLDEAVLSQIRLLQMDPSAVPEGTKKGPDERPALRAQLARLDSQISRLLDLYADGVFSLDVLNEKTEALRQARASCQERLDALDAAPASSDRALAALRSFPEVIEAANMKDLQLLVRDLIERVDYADDEVRIRWKLL